MNRLILSTLLLCVGVVLTAQRYSTGELQLTNGRVLTGQVAIPTWDFAPTYVLYRNSATDVPVQYGPAEVALLKVEERRYRGAVVQVERSASKLDNLRQGKEWQFTTDTLLLQYVVEGDRPLWVVRQVAGNDQYYIAGPNGAPELLRFKRYLKSSLKERSSVRERRDFVSQLANYLTDCPAVRSGLQELAYTERSLLGLFRLHAGCLGESLTVLSDAKGKAVRTRLGGGMNVVQHRIVSDGDRRRSLYSGSGRVRPMVFLSIDVIPKMGRSSLFFTHDIVLLHTGNLPGRVSGRTAPEDVLSVTHLQYAFLVAGDIPNGELRGAHIGLGLSVGFSVGDDEKIKQADLKTAAGETALLAQFGYRVDRLTFTLRGSYGSGMIGIDGTRTSSTKVALGATYTLSEHRSAE